MGGPKACTLFTCAMLKWLRLYSHLERSPEWGALAPARFSLVPFTTSTEPIASLRLRRRCNLGQFSELAQNAVWQVPVSTRAHRPSPSDNDMWDCLAACVFQRE